MRSIAITNQKGGVGKTTTALNVSATFALMGKSALLVDTDPQANSTISFVENPQQYEKSLYDVLSNHNASIKQIIVPSTVPGLEVAISKISMAKLEPALLGQIDSHFRMKDALEPVRKKYDYIVIDTPPYGMLTDSFVLMKFADIKIYVARLGYVKKRILVSSLEDIEAKNIDNVQILLNGESPKQGSYGKYYTNHRKGILTRKTKPQSRKNSSKVPNKHKMEV